MSTNKIIFSQQGALTVGGTAVPCPQSIDLTPSKEMFEFYCPTASGKQKIVLGTNWTGSITFFPDKDDFAEINAFNGNELLGVTAYPSGTAAGMKITLNAYVSTGLSAPATSAGSATINLDVNGVPTFATV